MSDTPPDLPGVTHRFVEVNGVKLHVAEAGQGEPVLLLHGWPQCWWMWRFQIPELAKKYRVIAPDLRGFGWSDAPPGNYEKEALADDILALMDALQIPRVRLMAHDWGGWIGFLLCIRAPQRFSRYLALNIPHPFQHFTLKRLKHLWRFWYQWLIATPWLGAWSVRTWMVRAMMMHGYAKKRLTPQDVELYVGRLAQPARAYASTLLYRSFVLREFAAVTGGRYHASRLKTPTLLLFGERDVAIPTDLLYGYEGNADDMRVELVPGVSHFIAEDAPEIVTARVLGFFAAA